MSSSSETGRLIVGSSVPGTRITVLNSGLLPAAVSLDSLDIELPAGVYHIESEVGGVVTEDLVSLAPGLEIKRDRTVQFPAAAPVVGTSTESAADGTLASALSERLAKSDGPDAGLVLQLRNLPGFTQGPLQPDRLSLYDSSLVPAHNWLVDWTLTADGGSIGRCKRFEPGPYILRSERDIGPQETESHDQTLWLSPGFQTLVFVPNGPAGPEVHGASVHMVPLYETWSGSDVRALELEAVLAELRGPDIVQSGELRQLAQRITVDPAFPMLSLLRLHLLVRATDDVMILDTVIERLLSELYEALASHPDVLALASRGDLGAPPVHWPPMLANSYLGCLLPESFSNEEVLPAGSPAERVALYQRPSAPWLQWEAGTEVAMPFGVTANALRDREAAVLAESIRAPGAAVSRVEDVLRQISTFTGSRPQSIVEQLGRVELARRCQLPRTLVEAALRELGIGAQVVVMS